MNVTTRPASIETRPVSVVIDNSASGKIVDVPAVTKNRVDARTILEGVRTVVNKSIVDLVIGGVRTDIKVGGRVKTNRQEDGISIDMMVRTVSYDFGGLTTKISGESVISLYEQTEFYK